MPPGVRDQVEDQLAASARVCERVMAERVAQLAVSAQLLARDYGFRDAVATADGPTIRSALGNQQRRIGADLAAVIDLDGAVVAALAAGGAPAGFAPGEPRLPAALLAQAEATGSAARVVALADRLYQVAVVPVMAPVPIAWIVLGTELDAAAARDITALSPIALDLAFLARRPDGRLDLVAASAEAPALAAFLSGPDADPGDRLLRDIHEIDGHLFRGLPLVKGEPRPEAVAVIHYPLEVAMRGYARLVAILLLVTAGGLVVLLGGSVLVSRGVTRPLRELARASRLAAAGDYRAVAAPARDVEFNDLTDGFNQMIGAVREREQRILFQACHDAETGLPNRVDFERRLAAQLESGLPASVALVEIGNLVDLRVVLGHGEVNELMAAVGERLAGLAGSATARLSTDTFALLLVDGEGEDHDARDMAGNSDRDRRVESRAAVIRNSFLAPFTVGDLAVDVTVRLGLVSHPRDGADIASLLRHAHAALDGARRHPQGLAWYDPADETSRARRLSLMSDLRQGLANGEVTFAYQPKLDLASGTVTAVEALVRWRSPTRGFVPPDEFIPLAERTGDIRLLTEWGLRTVVRQLAAWDRHGCDVAIAVNLSTSDLLNPRLVQLVSSLLVEHAVPAARLKLEVTESAVMQDTARALAVLGELAAMGLSLAIDDYGTGYSSLGYLKRLPVSEIKIDKSFVTHLATSAEDNILVRSTIELGHNLGLSVTAEGVEDEESLRRLRAYGCDTIQGYLISKPLPLHELETFLGSTAHVEA